MMRKLLAKWKTYHNCHKETAVLWLGFGGTIALGLLVSITLFVAMFTNLLFLPSLLLTFRLKFKGAKDDE